MAGAAARIPVGVKDIIYARGAPTEAGSEALKGFDPDRDATVVRRLKEAGAVVVGKTHTIEFAYGQSVPPTRNAWNADHAPGGSSSGSGTAAAIRSAFGAIGTDGGGSIRNPSSFQGIVGLKPTCGRVSREGVIPMSASLDHVGPMTRTVEDCASTMNVVAGSSTRSMPRVSTSRSRITLRHARRTDPWPSPRHSSGPTFSAISTPSTVTPSTPRSPSSWTRALVVVEIRESRTQVGARHLYQHNRHRYKRLPQAPSS